MGRLGDAKPKRANRYELDTSLLTLKKTVTNFGLISSREDLEEVTISEKIYKFVFNFTIVSYGLFLGMTTLLSWKEIISDWVFGILIFRILFTLFFALDFYFTLYASSLEDIFYNFQFFVDLVFLLMDIAIIIHMAIICIKCSGGSNSLCATLATSLRYLFCICIFRLYKLCYVFKPLLKLSKGILLTLKSLWWTGVFVFIVIYCCSILTTWLLNDVQDETMNELWGSLVRSMYTLFTVVTLEGWNEVSGKTATYYPYCKIFFVMFVSFTTLTVMNVVTGIIFNTFISAKEALSAENQYKDTFEKQFNLTNTISNALMSMNRKDYLHEFILEDQDHEIYTRDNRIFSRIGNLFREIFGLSKADRIKRHIESQSGYRKTSSIRFPFPRKDSANSSPETGSYNSDKNPSTGFTCSEKGRVDDIKLVVDHEPENVDRDESSSHKSTNLEKPTYGKEKSEPLKRASTDSIEEMCSNIEKWPSDLDEELTFNYTNDTKYQTGMINLTKNEPLDMINDPAMEKALRSSNIPKYVAYDVLNLYWANGFREIRASDFAIACSKIASGANNRQILALELLLTKRMDTIEAAVSQISENINTLMMQLNKVKEDHKSGD
ncbi:hypothetical protein BEWA_021240 [Theileria equi strain WA]|uniref:Ion transport domain-containing protein n=1 Tax=Theileria equi strain WA TaxID=1537102 RepID=L0AW69_THEEQ|nr:hypothetical protein BEWA_021240 [Theileria equi strain WA]AFZ79276.1 hypothetical protein BEWA_021240 [Theileria equi strain WA]|eukprot:XP_004828942.1 hypothetical protein BEWA_021240 [Theileria equi strain WA]